MKAGGIPASAGWCHAVPSSAQSGLISCVQGVYPTSLGSPHEKEVPDPVYGVPSAARSHHNPVSRTRPAAAAHKACTDTRTVVFKSPPWEARNG